VDTQRRKIKYTWHKAVVDASAMHEHTDWQVGVATAFYADVQ